jgi:hypothetical protein
VLKRILYDHKNVPVIGLNDWMDEEEDVVNGEGWGKEKNRGKEHAVVYIGDMLDVKNAMGHGKLREVVGSSPPAVTRSGSVVKMDDWGQ